MSKTSIEWTEHSANPIRFRLKDTGKTVHFCVKESSGCAHCYSETISRRWGSPEFIARNLDKVECFLDEKVLKAILKRRKPTTFFLADMTDWMGSWVPDEFIDKILATVALCPQHTFQLLTKRAGRMAKYFAIGKDRRNAIYSAAEQVSKKWYPSWLSDPWPLQNLWLGVSCENQVTADERIPHLLRTPAAVRFVSAEPLIGPIDLKLGSERWRCSQCGFVGSPDDEICMGRCGHCWHELDEREDCGIGWVIAGGESGSRARPCEVEWIRSLVRQCREAEVPCFTKQLGRWPVIRESTAQEYRDGADEEHQWPEGTSFGNPLGRLKDLNGRVVLLNDAKGGDPDEWPAELRIREFPRVGVEAAR